MEPWKRVAARRVLHTPVACSSSPAPCSYSIGERASYFGLPEQSGIICPLIDRVPEVCHPSRRSSMVEHPLCKRLVAGSIPAGGSNKKEEGLAYWDGKQMVYLPEREVEGYPNWRLVDCGCCAGIEWGGDYPQECQRCGGSGGIYKHIRSGLLADYPGGPLRGRASDTGGDDNGSR